MLVSCRVSERRLASQVLWAVEWLWA